MPPAKAASRAEIIQHRSRHRPTVRHTELLLSLRAAKAARQSRGNVAPSVIRAALQLADPLKGVSSRALDPGPGTLSPQQGSRLGPGSRARDDFLGGPGMPFWETGSPKNRLCFYWICTAPRPSLRAAKAARQSRGNLHKVWIACASRSHGGEAGCDEV